MVSAERKRKGDLRQKRIREKFFGTIIHKSRINSF